MSDFALYAEGTTDQRFLVPVIKRLLKNKAVILEFEAGIISLPTNLKAAEAILEAAKEAAYYDILIIHRDVDKRDWQTTYNQLIKPGLDKIKEVQRLNPNLSLCQNIVPLLPQHTVEAWMIADHATLIEKLGTSKKADQLGLPKLREVERRANPKEILKAALRLSLEGKSQREQATFSKSLGSLYEDIGEGVDLEILRQLESFQRFEADLTFTLHELGFLS